jgi:hypothetical protein
VLGKKFFLGQVPFCPKEILDKYALVIVPFRWAAYSLIFVAQYICNVLWPSATVIFNMFVSWISGSCSRRWENSNAL